MLNEDAKSQFNDALGYLRDLRGYFRAANMCNANSDLYGWWINLQILFSELSNYIKDEQEKEIRLNELMNLREEINQEINKSNANPYQKRVPINLFWKLYNFQLYIKKIYFDSGLETKMQDSALNALR